MRFWNEIRKAATAFSREDAENWVYWANTVLSGISIIDDDPDVVPCRCGTSSVYGY